MGERPADLKCHESKGGGGPRYKIHQRKQGGVRGSFWRRKEGERMKKSGARKRGRQSSGPGQRPAKKEGLSKQESTLRSARKRGRLLGELMAEKRKVKRERGSQGWLREKKAKKLHISPSKE